MSSSATQASAACLGCEREVKLLLSSPPVGCPPAQAHPAHSVTAPPPSPAGRKLNTNSKQGPKVQPRVPLTQQQASMYASCFVCQKTLNASQYLMHIASPGHVRKVTTKLETEYGYAPEGGGGGSEEPPAKKAKLG